MYRNRLLALVAALVAAPAWAAEPAAPLSSLAKMPVKEVTVFKDGHAFVLHQGTMPTDASGNVLLDNLPTPVLGTFWPFSADKKVTLKSVTVGRRRVKVERTALTLRELIEANPGAEVVVTETTQKTYPATIVKFLGRTAEEVEATSPPGPGEHLPMKSNVLLLKTVDGTKAVPVENIKDVKFVGQYKTTVTDEEYRNLLTLHLDWGGKPPEKNVDIGMAYLQKGIRWIPQYRVEIDGKGKAAVKLQATLLNEMTDLSDATLHLVVGVPSFYFKETADPIALNQAMAQLSQYFQTDAGTGNYLSNSMMTQVARGGEVRPAAPAAGGGGPPNLGPEIDGGGKTEDMYVYPVKNVTLKRGQRMVLPVTQTTLAYKDVFVLTVPFAPPPEMVRHANDSRAAEIQKMMLAPKVQHNLRLTNSAEQPLTTAPAMILKEGRLLAQGMMTYTGRGGTTDLQVTTAVDIKVKKTDKETKRTPNAAEFEGNRYWRIDASGAISLTNYRGQAVEVEIVRFVLGNVGETAEGQTEMVNALEDDAYLPATARPPWWNYYSWPSWWYHFNGIGRITWTRTIEPGKAVDLNYTWHYYWR